MNTFKQSLISRLNKKYTNFTFNITINGDIAELYLNGNKVNFNTNHPKYSIIQELLKQLAVNHSKLNVQDFVYTPLEEYIDNL